MKIEKVEKMEKNLAILEKNIITIRLLQAAIQQLERVHLDLYSSFIISIEGCKDLAVYTD